jgi:hypothetical protein
MQEKMNSFVYIEHENKLDNANVGQLQENLVFDHKLREKAQIRHTTAAMTRFQFQKKWLSKMKNLALTIYFLIVPFLQTPGWCIAYFKAQDSQIHWVYNCRAVDDGHILYSNLPKFNPILLACIDFTCIGSLVFYMWYKTTWR